jgi:hypothetical protein
MSLFVVTGNLPCLTPWDPADPRGLLTEGSEPGLLWVAFAQVPAGEYEFKVACDGSWAENYGADGRHDGGNIRIRVPPGLARMRISFHTVTHSTLVYFDEWWLDCPPRPREAPATPMQPPASSLADRLRGSNALALHIMSFLDAASLCRAARASRAMHTLALADALWRPLALRFFPILAHRTDDGAWMAAFRRRTQEPATTLADILGGAELGRCAWYQCANVSVWAYIR